MARKTFPFPLHLADLDEFTCPVKGHDLNRPFLKDGNAFAGNGYLAIRCHRGLWMSSDFQEPTPEAENRLAALPWENFQTFADRWRKTDDITGTLFRYAPIGVWNSRNRISPCPVWWVAETHRVRLSMLQLIARLPRCEIYTGPSSKEMHLAFRFTGGVGFIAYDDRLTTHSFEIFTPQRCKMDGEVIATGPRPTFKMFKDWPPAEPIDD